MQLKDMKAGQLVRVNSQAIKLNHNRIGRYGHLHSQIPHTTMLWLVDLVDGGSAVFYEHELDVVKESE